MELALLRDHLDGIDQAADPDGWAIGAYRLALAESEMATGPEDLRSALALLERASRILSRDRAPIEHARIITAAAQCHRALGDAQRAQQLFADAADLQGRRGAPGERAAALVNLGLAAGEAGDPERALAALDQAVTALEHARDEEGRRLLAAARLNRAQVHQQTVDGLDRAVADYVAAIQATDPQVVQHGMAQHGLGTALLERHRLRAEPEDLARAHAALDAARRTLTAEAFPFHRAIATHSAAVAHQTSGGAGNLRVALALCELAMSVLDPRLHAAQWRTVAATASEVEAELRVDQPDMDRVDHLVALVSSEEHASVGRAILAERLTRLVGMPAARVNGEMGRLVEAAARAGEASFDRVVRLLLGVLMELPEVVLASATAALAAADGRGRGYEPARVVDAAIHDLLHGPQRVRVRDLLEANGWERP